MTRDYSDVCVNLNLDKIDNFLDKYGLPKVRSFRKFKQINIYNRNREHY